MSYSFLFCEDHDMYIETVLEMFRLFEPDDNITVVRNLYSLLEVLKAYPRFDAIILDLNLPDCSELETLKRVIEYVHDSIPIIILTAYAQWKTEAIKLGAKLYKIKTEVDGESLVKSIHNVVANND